jgi:hypothetical protein
MWVKMFESVVSPAMNHTVLVCCQLQSIDNYANRCVSDLGNNFEFANSLVPSPTLNQARTEHTSTNGGFMPRQKTREELEERIDELEAENEGGRTILDFLITEISNRLFGCAGRRTFLCLKNLTC